MAWQVAASGPVDAVAPELERQFSALPVELEPAETLKQSLRAVIVAALKPESVTPGTKVTVAVAGAQQRNSELPDGAVNQLHLSIVTG